jgi:hypothetical protein
MRLLLPIIALGILILCLTLFFESLVGERRGREAEENMESTFRKLERKTGADGGRVGDWTRRFLAWVRSLGHRSASAGRALRDRIAR